jgi:SAM-dependent methyltransferase
MSATILTCWQCSAPLIELSDEAPAATCPHCHTITTRVDGIWRCLPPDRAAFFKPFMTEYEFIRSAESRGSSDPAYYLALPFEDLTGTLAEQWRIRAITFRHLLPLLKRPLRILDLGAGNGWLSYRLSLMGHSPVAVDLQTGPRDGLGAAHHYATHLKTMFPLVEASLDHLPFEDQTFDLAIFNASFHYSEDFEKTLAEAVRCTRRGGAVAIADTPWYQHESSGLEMVEEKHKNFQARFGFPSNSLASMEFLTPPRLQSLAAALGIRWRTIKPFYGLRWALRPLRAKLQKRRTPSRFHIFVAEVPA